MTIMEGKNFNIAVKATRIPGVKEMKAGDVAPCEGIFIPIDNRTGFCINGYKSKLPDGGVTTKYIEDVELNFTAYALRQPTVTGGTHGVKPTLSKEMLESMDERQVRTIPWCGYVTPWTMSLRKGARREERR